MNCTGRSADGAQADLVTPGNPVYARMICLQRATFINLPH